MRALRALAIVGAGVSGLLSFGTVTYADEAEHGLSCPNYPWPYQGILSSKNPSSIRRGQKVFQSDCSSCHSMSLVSYRDLTSVAYTKEEANGISAEIEVVDGSSHEREMFTCLGKLDYSFPQPYSNGKAAKFAYGRAYSPDLSLISKIREGVNYNPYFSGGAIAMPKMLKNGPAEYEQ